MLAVGEDFDPRPPNHFLNHTGPNYQRLENKFQKKKKKRKEKKKEERDYTASGSWFV